MVRAADTSFASWALAAAAPARPDCGCDAPSLCILPKPAACHSLTRILRNPVLGAAAGAFSQGIAYFHAGQERLRSKSMVRNSYDSGNWCNPIDQRLEDNLLSTCLPPEPDNGANWPLMAPLPARASADRRRFVVQ